MHSITCMNLKNIVLHERSPLQRPHVIWFHLHERRSLGESIYIEKILVLRYKRYRVSSRGNKNVLKLIAVMNAQLCEYTKATELYYRWVVKYMNYISIKLFSNITLRIQELANGISCTSGTSYMSVHVIYFYVFLNTFHCFINSLNFVITKEAIFLFTMQSVTFFFCPNKADPWALPTQ